MPIICCFMQNVTRRKYVQSVTVLVHSPIVFKYPQRNRRYILKTNHYGTVSYTYHIFNQFSVHKKIWDSLDNKSLLTATPYYLCWNLRLSLACLWFLIYTRSVLVRHFSVGQKVLICSEFVEYICVIRRLQKYCINIHCQLNQCAFPCVILSCLSICMCASESLNGFSCSLILEIHTQKKFQPF
jgi:hypothetical protein